MVRSETPLDLQQQVAQMIVVSASGRLGPETLQGLIEEVGIGGIRLTDGQVAETFLRIQQWQRWAKVPLLVGASPILEGATVLPPLGSLAPFGRSACRWAKTMGQITAREATAVGINWLIAPALPFDARAEMLDWAAAFWAGSQSEGALTSAQIGAVGSRLLPKLSGLEPFQRELVADTVVMASLRLPDWDEVWPAPLSEKILQQIVRQRWQFQGLIVSDALASGPLGALYKPGDLVLRAVRAGVDLLLDPPHPRQVIRLICRAVERGEIPLEQIERSVSRILRAKLQVMPAAAPLLQRFWPRDPLSRGIIADRLKSQILSQPIPGTSSLGKALPTLVADSAGAWLLQAHIRQPEALACQAALSRGMVQGSRIRLCPQPDWLNWIWVPELSQALYLNSRSPAIAAATARNLPTLLSDHITPMPWLEQALERASSLMVQWFVEAEGLPPWLPHLLQEHLSQVRVLVCYGDKIPTQIHQMLQEEAIPCLWAADKSALAQAEVMRRILVRPKA